FDGQSGALVAAVLRPGKRPFGNENAMIMRRVLTLIRRHFPDTVFSFGATATSADPS
ncbi:MAG: family transposase, partial [Massilia sp.]|nr:family transposase [Massilia sp.]